MDAVTTLKGIVHDKQIFATGKMCLRAPTKYVSSEYILFLGVFKVYKRVF